MENTVERFDENFRVETNIQRSNIKFYSPLEPPFSIHGVIFENGSYVRMPEAAAKSVSEAVLALSKHSAGGRIRFVTDSSYLIVKAKYKATSIAGQMAILGRYGFDLYVDYGEGEKYFKSYIPTVKDKTEYEGVVDFRDNRRKKTVTINLPLTAEVAEIYLGLYEPSLVEAAPDYRIKTPIVYYGSSITQGGCASRPGTCYTSMLSRRYGADYLNLGFSGSAKGEETMAKYVADLDMSIFVYDYDYNSPTLEEYEATHEAFFRIIRDSHPDIPIVIATRPRYNLNDDHLARIEIARRTYERAIESGDKNVYFVDGRTLMDFAKEDGLVDDTHPNDLGFFNMTQGFARVMDRILGYTE